MQIKYVSALTMLVALCNTSGFAMTREIAITIDDLPFVGTNSNDAGNLTRSHNRFMDILQSLIENHVPATGFIIAGAIGRGQWNLLEEFRNAGFALGNHTYSHANLNRMSAESYINEIARADKILDPIMTTPKYFRYPYLAEGRGAIKQEVQDYLTTNQYTIAPVTIDSKDYMFNARLLHVSWRIRDKFLPQIKQQYLAYIWKETLRAEKRSSNDDVKQILLVHSNLLNSHFLGDVIQMYKQHGYKFISLTQALTHTAPAINNVVTPDSNNIKPNSDILSSIEKVW